MLIIRGVNVFPSQIETVLLNHGYEANYQIFVDRVNNTDTLDVNVERKPDMGKRSRYRQGGGARKLVSALRSMLGITANVPSRRAQVHRAERRQGRARHR